MHKTKPSDQTDDLLKKSSDHQDLRPKSSLELLSQTLLMQRELYSKTATLTEIIAMMDSNAWDIIGMRSIQTPNSSVKTRYTTNIPTELMLLGI